MRRKRRTKYTWLFNTGTTGPVAQLTDATNGRDFGTLTTAANGTTQIKIVDLLNDEPTDDAQTGLPMGVYTWDNYVVRRIVGKFFANASNVSSATIGTALVGAGIFVARAADLGGAGADNTIPIGSNVSPDAEINYSPLSVDAIRQPWIWRRTWLLSNQSTTDATQVTTFPKTTSDYGSVQDGPHIDAKTMRRVGTDERLFAVFAIRNYPLNSTITAGTGITVRAYIDYRVLGAMRRSKGRSAF